MASGVAALVRHLPAGNPSIFYCIHSLVEKATCLCSTVKDHNSDLWKNWEGELEPSKKVLDLLLRLLSLVDIQVQHFYYEKLDWGIGVVLEVENWSLPPVYSSQKINKNTWWSLFIFSCLVFCLHFVLLFIGACMNLIPIYDCN